MAKKLMPPRIAVIPAAQPPRVGKWNFDSIAPLDGYRGSDPAPVIVRGKLAWAHYWERTEDGGTSVSESGWESDDPYWDQGEQINPKFWLRIKRGEK